MDKSLIVVIDSFSDRVFDYSNTLLLDYGYFSNVTFYDNLYDIYTGAYSGYGNYDDFYINSTDAASNYYFVTNDDDGIQNGVNTSTTNAVDLDLLSTQTFTDAFGFVAQADTYDIFYRTDQQDDSSVNHGDWVVETICQGLENPERSVILCIDVDTLNGADAHYTKLFDFDLYNSLLAETFVTKFESLIYDFYTFFDERFNNGITTDRYVLAGASMSISGLPNLGHSNTIKTFEQMGSLFIQSAPNTNSSVGYDFGNIFPDVLNVGAWNVDSNGNLLLAKDTAISTVDIVANGYVQKTEWGTNFGTSFATPAVTAQFLNLINDVLIEMNGNGDSLPDVNENEPVSFDYSNLVSSVVGMISTDIYYSLNNDGTVTSEVIPLLTATLDKDGVQPTLVPGAVSGLTNYSASEVSTNANAVFSSGTLTSGQHYPGKKLTASLDIADANGTSNAVKTFKWYRSDGSNYTEIQSGTDDTYTISEEDVGYIIAFAVSFTDDDGNVETSSYNFLTGKTVVPVNVSAIFSNATLTSGIHSPGKTLTASLEVQDDNGLENATKSYTWYRFDGSSYTEIVSNSSHQYTIQQADLGYVIAFELSVLDDHGYSEASSKYAFFDNLVRTDNAPTLTTSNSITISEDTPTEPITFSGVDADGDTLTYTFSDPAKGSVVNNNDGTFTYTPDANVNGSDTFTITVNDGTNNVTETINVTINAVNDAPTVSSSATASIDEDSAYSYTFTASDVDVGDTLTLSSVTIPSWLSFDVSTGILSGTPTNDDVGEHDVTLRVHDGTVDVDQSFKVTVTNTNDDPDGELVIIGDWDIDQTLTIDTSNLSDEDGLGQFSYQWYSDGHEIIGATSKSLILTSSDIKTDITAKVNYVDGQQTSESVESKPYGAWGPNEYLSDSITLAQAATVRITMSSAVMISPTIAITAAHSPLDANNTIEENLTVQNIYGEVRDIIDVKYDLDADFAYIELDSPFDNSYSVEISDTPPAALDATFAVGNPKDTTWGGVGWAVSFGEARGIDYKSYFDLFDIQTMGGFSGGGVFNAEGKLVGIISGKTSAYSEGSSRILNQSGFEIFQEEFSILDGPWKSLDSMQTVAVDVAFINNFLNSYAITNTPTTTIPTLPLNLIDPEFNPLTDLEETNLALVADPLRKSVVAISTRSIEQDVYPNGSGVFLTNQIIATNSHVIEGKEEFLITLFDGTEITGASVLDNHPEMDVSLILLPQPISESFTSVQIAQNRPNLGDTNFAIGHPFDLWLSNGGWQVTSAISGYVTNQIDDRGDILFEGYSAGGMSGGPIFNSSGELVGLTYATGAGISQLLHDYQDPHITAYNPIVAPEVVNISGVDAAGIKDLIERNSIYFDIDTAQLTNQNAKFISYDANSVIRVQQRGKTLDIQKIENGKYIDWKTLELTDQNFDAIQFLALAQTTSGFVAISQYINNSAVGINATFLNADFSKNYEKGSQGSLDLLSDTSQVQKILDTTIYNEKLYILGQKSVGQQSLFYVDVIDLTSGNAIKNLIDFSNDTTSLSNFFPASFNVNAHGIRVTGTTDHSDVNVFSRTFDHFVAQFSVDGVLDKNFGINGVFQTDFGDTDKVAKLVQLDDGKILISGINWVDAAPNVVVTRLTDSGMIDTTFGENGSTSFGIRDETDLGREEVTDLLIGPDGSIYLAGSKYVGQTNNDLLSASDGSYQNAIWKFDTHGRKVEAFGDGGASFFGDETSERITEIFYHGESLFASTSSRSGNILENDIYSVDENTGEFLRYASIAPTINTTTSLKTDEDTATAAIAFSGADVDGDTLTFVFSDPAKGSVVDNGDDTFTYTPDANANGSDSFTITVNDGTVNVTETINVAISGVQDAPTITSTAEASVAEDSAYSYTFAASDLDGDTLTLSSVTLPSWLSFDASSGVLTGTPTNDHVGEHDVTLRVNDGTVDVDQSFKVTVSNTNDAAAGTVSISGDYTVKETLSLETTNITDQDGLGTFSYKWFRDGSVIQSAKQAQYTLKASDIGAIISAEVSFIDGFGTLEIISATAPKKVTPKVASTDDIIIGTASADTIYAGEGADLVSAGAGSDTIELWSSSAYHYGYYGRNIDTGSRVSIRYKTKYSSVIDGEADADTIILMDGSNGDAFFLHDAYSDLHESVSTTSDDKGMQTAARVISIETILAGDGDDIIDLTSDTFDMGGTNITLKGEAGDDVLWAAEGDDTLDGGLGDDTLFGGAGTNILTGGSGADEFQFTKTSTKDRVEDFSIDEGDTLKFFNKGGAIFDKSSAALENGNLTIKYGSNVQDQLTVYVGNDDLTISEISDAIIVV